MRRWIQMAAVAAMGGLFAGAMPAGDALARPGLEVPHYDASAPEAPPVTQENLLESERFWPYQVELLREWSPAGGGKSVPAGVLGVLVRVEAGGRARVDFGREGVHEIPVARTDLVERANRVRKGALDKLAPNFVHAIGTRLADPSGERLRAMPFARVFEPRAFLAVFADPASEEFAALAAALRPLQDREDLGIVLFPQGRHPDERLHRKLAELDWRAPFVLDHLAESYIRSLRSPEEALPALVLQTPEGRVLFEATWHLGAASEPLEAAIEQALAEEALAEEGEAPDPDAGA